MRRVQARALYVLVLAHSRQYEGTPAAALVGLGHAAEGFWLWLGEGAEGNALLAPSSAAS